VERFRYILLVIDIIDQLHNHTRCRSIPTPQYVKTPLFFTKNQVMKVLLVSIAIGEKCLHDYNLLFRSNQSQYAEKHGYDFKVVTEPIDNTHGEIIVDNRNIIPYMQKSLVCELNEALDYDFVVYVDTDVYINCNSPPIHTHHEFGDKIGVVDEWAQPSYDEKAFVHEFYELPDRSPNDYIKRNGFGGIGDLGRKLMNSGVIVFQPRKHKAHMQAYYDWVIHLAPTTAKTLHYEQASLSYYLTCNNLLFWMDKKFNAIWNHQFSVFEIHQVSLDPAPYFKQNYFVHLVEKRHHESVPIFAKINMGIE